MRVEEEQLVRAAGPPDRTTDGVAPVSLHRTSLGNAVFLVGPGVRIPFRVSFDVVYRAVELVRAALGNGGDLHTAGAAIFGLIALGQDLDLGDRVHVRLQHLAVVAGVHDGHAVHHHVVVVRARAAQPNAPDDTGGDRRERRPVAAVDGKVLDRFGGDGERPFTGLRLNDRRLARDHDGLG